MCISVFGRSRNSLVGSSSIARPSIKTSCEVRRPRQRPAFPSAQGTGCTNSSAPRQYGVSSKLIGLTLRHAELGLQRIRPARRQILDLRDRRLQRATLFGCGARRSEEHTSELQSLMRNSYAVFCLKKKKITCTLSRHNYMTI